MIGFVCSGLYHDATSNESYMVLHQSRGSAIAVSNGRESKLLLHLPTMDNKRRKNSLNRLIQLEDFQKTALEIDSLPAMINYKNIPLIVVDESVAFVESNVRKPIVLLSNSPKVNLDKVITKLDPRLIISDGSNYRNFVDRWKATCIQREVEFINTYDEGAIDLLRY